MSQSPVTVTYSLEEVLKQINEKLEKLNKIEVELAEIKTELKNLKEDVKEIKGSQKAQIWSLIILSFTAVVGLLGTIATVAIRLFFQKP
jgi:prefoldin subunit 5